MTHLIVLRGGGDLASGVALRLHRAGFKLAITELEKPVSVRRSVSFSEAVYEGEHTVEGTKGRLVSADQLEAAIDAGEIPVLVDPQADVLLHPFLTSRQSVMVVDARMLKAAPEPLRVDVPLHIGLGPGFCAGENCHVVIETRRGHTMGRVYWSGSAETDSGEPDGDRRRVLRAAHEGVLVSELRIGELVAEGQRIAEIRSADGGSFSIMPSATTALRSDSMAASMAMVAAEGTSSRKWERVSRLIWGR